MKSSSFGLTLVVLCLQASNISAQHHHGMHCANSNIYPVIYYPVYVQTPYWPQNIQVVNYAAPINYAVPSNTVVPIPSKPLSGPMAAEAKLKSLEFQVKGDQKMREQKWSDAKAAYSKSVKAAPDRAEALMRLGLVDVALRRFDSAINEFKRALILDPNMGKNSKKLDSIFGAENKIAVNSMISKLGDWVGEDLRNSDRLFLLGAVLFLNQDPRANDVLQAAIKTNNSIEVTHITAFVIPPIETAAITPQPSPDGLPALKNLPMAPAIVPEETDIRFPKRQTSIPLPPVPMP